MLTRMATHPLMVAKVKSWRDSHSDWEALAAFLLSKNTGRRFKQKGNFSQENLNVPKASSKLDSLAQKPKPEMSIGDRLLTISDQKVPEDMHDRSKIVGGTDRIERSDSSDCDSSISDKSKTIHDHYSDSGGSGEENDSDDGGTGHHDSGGDSSTSEPSDEESPDDIATKRALLLGHSVTDSAIPTSTTADSVGAGSVESTAHKQSVSSKKVHSVKSQTKVKKCVTDVKMPASKSSPKQDVEHAKKKPSKDHVASEGTDKSSCSVKISPSQQSDTKPVSNKKLTFRSGKEMVIKKISLDNLDEELKVSTLLYHIGP